MPHRYADALSHTRRPKWSAAADAALATLYADGKSLRKIASAMRVSRNAVVARACCLGLHAPRKAADRHAASASAGNTVRDARAANLTTERTSDPLPAGHTLSWGLITAGTCLQGQPYVAPKPSGRLRVTAQGLL